MSASETATSHAIDVHARPAVVEGPEASAGCESSFGEPRVKCEPSIIRGCRGASAVSAKAEASRARVFQEAAAREHKLRSGLHRGCGLSPRWHAAKAAKTDWMRDQMGASIQSICDESVARRHAELQGQIAQPRTVIFAEMVKVEARISEGLEEQITELRHEVQEQIEESLADAVSKDDLKGGYRGSCARH